MTRPKKTFKDLKERRDLASALHDAREGLRQERGGRRNLLKEYVEEEMEDLGQSEVGEEGNDEATSVVS